MPDADVYIPEALWRRFLGIPIDAEILGGEVARNNDLVLQLSHPDIPLSAKGSHKWVRCHPIWYEHSRYPVIDDWGVEGEIRVVEVAVVNAQT